MAESEKRLSSIRNALIVPSLLAIIQFTLSAILFNQKITQIQQLVVTLLSLFSLAFIISVIIPIIKVREKLKLLNKFKEIGLFSLYDKNKEEKNFELYEKNYKGIPFDFIEKILNSGIINIYFSRDEMRTRSSITEILKNLDNNSNLFIAARSGIAWATHFELLEDIMHKKNIKITFLLPNPKIKTDDWAKTDLSGTFEKLKKIKYSENLKIYIVDHYFTFSFVNYIYKGTQTGWIELGANLPEEERFAIQCKDGIFLTKLIKVYEKYKTELKDIHTL